MWLFAAHKFCNLAILAHSRRESQCSYDPQMNDMTVYGDILLPLPIHDGHRSCYM